MDYISKSTIISPECKSWLEETMPEDRCMIYYDCPECGVHLKPKPGDCCIFCSFGSVKCPPKQEENKVGKQVN